MKIKSLPLKTGAALFFLLICAACAEKITVSNNSGALPDTEQKSLAAEKENPNAQEHERPLSPVSIAAAFSPGNSAPREADISLEQIAEMERSGSWVPGLALAESALREKAGDYAGAAVAAYRELSRAYGSGAVDKEKVSEGLQNALALFGKSSPAEDPARSSGTAALEGCAAFARGDWEKACDLLSGILSADEEPDSFLRWMLLVCALERRGENPETFRTARPAYGAIRARYASFPEYWYRGARAFSAPGNGSIGSSIDNSIDGSVPDENIAAAFAERCIDSSPLGPFAAECRKILGRHLGIAPDADGSPADVRLDIRSKAEIENILRVSVSMNDPEVLEELFPLIALPDNPYTHYALGALMPFASVPEYRAFFLERASASPGRLGERLNFLARS